MEHASQRLLNSDQIRTLEGRAIAAGTSGYSLMTRAGNALKSKVQSLVPPGASVVILCGPGNNGGDGYVLARLLMPEGYQLRVLSILDDSQLVGDAATAAADWRQAGGGVEIYNGQLPVDADLLVDALFGIGLARPLVSSYLEAVEDLNRHSAPTLSVDIPSGIDSDTGVVMGVAVRADFTLTFLGWKLGLFLADGLDCRGSVELADLAVDVGFTAFTSIIELMPKEPPASLLPRRGRQSHKGMFGHVAIVGGYLGMSGAVRMAGEAALRVGCGLATIATHPAHAPMCNITLPELMSVPIHKSEELAQALARATVIAVGPGMVDNDWSRQCWEAVSSLALPLVIDAGALLLLEETPSVQAANRVYTPHPGEAAHMLSVTAADVQADRPGAARTLQQRLGGVVVLKGAGTIVAGKNGLALCDEGNAGMASGGMGDVLTGIIAGLIAQGLEVETAARVGVRIHARAGDLAADAEPRGLLATDLMPFLRQLVNP